MTSEGGGGLRVAAALGAALCLGAAKAEPPQPPGLSCRVAQQRVGETMSLQLVFSNRSDAELRVGLGPHIVWYADAAAEDPMERSARARRLQDAVLVLPPGGERSELYIVDAAALEQLRCNGARPAAAALYVYQFNPRPRFRCLLQDYDLDAVAPKTGCPPYWPPFNGPASSPRKAP
jgi:hypothetical protein